MGAETEYGSVTVLGKSAGMNQAAWDGAIEDAQTTMSYNMGTNIDGEWKKRQGYALLKTIVTTATGEALNLHWHTDEAADGAGSTWLDSATEVTAASSGALDVNTISLYSTLNPYWPLPTLDGEEVDMVSPTAAASYIGISSAPAGFKNFDADAGRIVFYFGAWFDGSFITPPKFTAYKPTKSVYILYGSTSFNLFINTSGDMIWKYGSGASEYLTYAGSSLDMAGMVKIELQWDNTTTGAIFDKRFVLKIDGASVANADPASKVTMSFDANFYLFNNGAGTSAPVTANWPRMGTAYIGLLSSYSDSAVTAYAPPVVTGIFNHSSQQRAVVTCGNAIYYSPSYAKASGVHALASGVRTSAVECQGNIYVVDGTTTMFYMIGTATAVTSYTLPETASYIEEYHGHLWIAGLGTNGAYSVRASTIDDFVTSSAVSWPSTNQIFKCRDTVRGIKSYAGNLIAMTRSTIEAISGYNPQDFAKTILSGSVGCASHWSIKECPIAEGTTALIWAGYDGIYMMMGTTIKKISQEIQEFWDTLSKVEIQEASAVECRNRGEYMLAVSDGSSAENNYILVYNYRKGDWSIWKYANKMDVLGKYYRSGEEIILGGDSNGNIFELNRGDSDNGGAINGYFLTKWFDCGLPDQDKDFRKLYAWVQPSGNYNVEVGWGVDYNESTTYGDVVVGTDGNDYACVVAHEPSVVVGTNGNDYYCILAHTSAADGSTAPITGASHATYWAATGTTGRGEVHAVSTPYISNIEKKPITGANYSLYWKPNNTVGAGSVWSALAAYASESVSMNAIDLIDIGNGAAEWGTLIWGEDVWGTGKSTIMVPIDLYNARGKSIRFMFRNQYAEQPFTIRGFKAWFTYVPEFPA